MWEKWRISNRLYYVIRPCDQQIPPSPRFDLKLCLNRFLTDFFSITTVQLVPSVPCPLFCVHPAFSNRWLKSEFIAAEWSFFSSYYSDTKISKWFSAPLYLIKMLFFFVLYLIQYMSIPQKANLKPTIISLLKSELAKKNLARIHILVV